MLTVMTDKKPTLEEAQFMVGGNVELITLDNGDQLLFNEEGKLIGGMEPNPEATALVGHWLMRGDFIVGPALLLKGEARWK